MNITVWHAIAATLMVVALYRLYLVVGVVIGYGVVQFTNWGIAISSGTPRAIELRLASLDPTSEVVPNLWESTIIIMSACVGFCLSLVICVMMTLVLLRYLFGVLS